MNARNVILDAQDINRIIARMAQEILQRHGGTEGLALVGIHTRGVFLARRIQAEMTRGEKRDIPVGEIDITLYRDDWTRISHHPVVRATHLDFSVDGQKILLVDDVLFTGRTVRAAMDAVIDFGRPDRIELAVLVDRGHRELPIQADYVGRFIETRRSETVNVLLQEYDAEDKVVVQ